MARDTYPYPEPFPGMCNFTWIDEEGMRGHRCGEFRHHHGSHYCGDTIGTTSRYDKTVISKTWECSAEFYVPPPLPSGERRPPC